jgi:hypothetical protein
VVSLGFHSRKFHFHSRGVNLPKISQCPYVVSGHRHCPDTMLKSSFLTLSNCPDTVDLGGVRFSKYFYFGGVPLDSFVPPPIAPCAQTSKGTLCASVPTPSSLVESISPHSYCGESLSHTSSVVECSKMLLYPSTLLCEWQEAIIGGILQPH